MLIIILKYTHTHKHTHTQDPIWADAWAEHGSGTYTVITRAPDPSLQPLYPHMTSTRSQKVIRIPVVQRVAMCCSKCCSMLQCVAMCERYAHSACVSVVIIFLDPEVSIIQTPTRLHIQAYTHSINKPPTLCKTLQLCIAKCYHPHSAIHCNTLQRSRSIPPTPKVYCL